MRKILSTRAIPASLVRAAEQAGAAVEVVEFITVHPRMSEETGRLIEWLAPKRDAAVVFTSKHAVASVAGYLEQLGNDIAPGWHLYCLSEVTRLAALKSFPLAIAGGEGSYAADLAKSILAAGPREVWFFCGNKRRDTLPEMLENGGVTVHQAVVYDTQLTPRPVQGFFDGILFFSPSGVESYFSVNQPDPRSIFFAIGNTTAGALSDRASNRVVVSKRQQATALIQTMTDYFSKNDPSYE